MIQKTIFHILLLVLLANTAAVGQNTEKQYIMDIWQYPYPVHHATVGDSVRVAYVDEGSGPVLLMVHGLGSNLQAWQKNIDSLRQHYRCIALDLPGYGKSSLGNYPYSPTFFADAVLALMAQLELDDVTLVGHSMGGQVAMHVALADSSRLSRLVLVAPAGFEQFTPQEHAWFATYVTPAFIKMTPEAQIVKNFEVNFHQMTEDARFMIADRLQMRGTADYDAYCDMIPHCVQGMLTQPVFDRLPDIKLPTLVIYGAADLLIPNRLLHPTLTVQAVAETATQRLPNAQLHLLPNAGHFVQWEAAGAVNALIMAWK